MPKKTKRQVRSYNGTASPSTAPTQASTSAPRRSSFARAAETEFNPDYTYVKKDLKRIGILSASFFSILIILAIIL